MSRKYVKSGECQKCGVWRRVLHRDHIIARVKGGTDELSNFQYLCANCHEDKTQSEDADAIREASRRAQAIRWAKPGARDRMRTPEHRALVSEATRRGQTPEVIEKYRQAQIRRYTDPAEREKTGSAIRAAQAAKTQEQRSEERRKSWVTRRQNAST